MYDQIILLGLTLLFSSNPTLTGKESTGHHPSFPYNLEQPDVVFEMPAPLKEISGLSLSGDGQYLVAVNDEQGTVFLINLTDGTVSREIVFWETGDYEGLEVVGDDVFVVKSNGTIYQVKNYLTDSLFTVKIKTFLNNENDVEGLAYNLVKNSLLLGCKGKIADGQDEKSAFKKAVYEFDLGSMSMKNDPAFLLTLPDIQAYIQHIEEHGEMEKLLEEFPPNLTELTFSPSGIAIHPVTGELYLTSAKGKMLLVLSQDGHIVHLKKLKKKTHSQPEGICFDAQGNLFIANEGKEDNAVIYKFQFRN